jgi:hypothetical protein
MLINIECKIDTVGVAYRRYTNPPSPLAIYQMNSTKTRDVGVTAFERERGRDERD